MARIEKFEDIEAWQRARELTKTIYAVSNDGKFAQDSGLRDQIRRGAVSVMSNIAEGFYRGGNRERTHFRLMIEDFRLKILDFRLIGLFPNRQSPIKNQKCHDGHKKTQMGF